MIPVCPLLLLISDCFRDVLASERADMKRQFQQTVVALQRGSYIENIKNVSRYEGKNGCMNVD